MSKHSLRRASLGSLTHQLNEDCCCCALAAACWGCTLIFVTIYGIVFLYVPGYICVHVFASFVFVWLALVRFVSHRAVPVRFSWCCLVCCCGWLVFSTPRPRREPRCLVSCSTRASTWTSTLSETRCGALFYSRNHHSEKQGGGGEGRDRESKAKACWV